MNNLELIEVFKNESSESLALNIVAFRILKCLKEEAKYSMAELMNRKANGDTFDYETFINNTIKETKIDLKVPPLNEIKKTIFESAIYSLLNPNQLKNEEKEEVVEIDEKKQKDLEDMLSLFLE